MNSETTLLALVEDLNVANKISEIVLVEAFLLGASGCYFFCKNYMLDSSVADTGTGLSKLTSKSSINDLLFSTNELQKTCYELNKLLVNLNS
jgi:hypothetical protein